MGVGLSTQLPLYVPTRENIADQRFGKASMLSQDKPPWSFVPHLCAKATAARGRKRARTFAPLINSQML